MGQPSATLTHMFECGFALAIFGLFALGTYAHARLAWEQLLGMGLITLLVGLVTSILGGALYHLQLARCLRPSGRLGRGWFWQPTTLHPLLTPQQRARVLPWFVLGAAGFLVCLLGCAAVLLAALR